jgi:OmpA-OmpF porin, OOP family
MTNDPAVTVEPSEGRCEECEAAAARLAKSKRRLIGTALLGGGALTAAAIFSPLKATGFGGVLQIEDKNEGNVLSELRKAGVTDLTRSNIDMSGRFATITGPVKGREELIRQAAWQWGVDNVTLIDTGEAAVLPAQPGSVGSPKVDAVIAGKRVTLNGTVLSQAQRETISGTAAETFGPGNVVDNLQVASDVAADSVGASDDEVAALAKSLAVLKGASSGTANLDGSTLNLAAEMPDDASRRAASDAIEEIRATSGVVGESTVLAATPASAAPTTAAPTTAPPTTAAPTTAAPTTTKPATTTTVPATTTTIPAPPTTAAPTEEAPGEVEAPPATPEPDPTAVSPTIDTAAAAATQGFDTDSVRLAAEPAELVALVEALTADSDARIRIEGYADSRGTVAYNELLGLRRAEAVRDWLVERGVDTDRIEVLGLGEANPLGDNGSESGRAANRRVEIKLASTPAPAALPHTL